MSELSKELRELKCGLFGERDTHAEALEFAMRLLKNEGASEMAIYTALGVVTNTLLENIAKVND